MKPRPPILYLVAACLAATVPVLAEDGRPVPEDLDACIKEVRALQADINLLNLVNGLNLTKEQVAGMLKEAQGVEEYLAPLDRTAREERALRAEEAEVLRAVRDRLLKEGAVPPTLEARWRVLEQRRHRMEGKWKLRPQALERIRSAAGRVERMLSGAQLQVLCEYQACLIPPKNLKDPVRVGQARSTGPGEARLEQVRALPDEVYGRLLPTIIEKLTAAAEHHAGAMDEAERKAYRKRVLETLKAARAMDDVEFALNKSDLAARLEPEDRAEVLVDRLASMGIERYGIQGRITRFLLVPRIIPILKKRLPRMKEGPGAARPTPPPKEPRTGRKAR